MQLMNARTSGVVASNVEIADTHAARRRGLLGRDGLPNQAALVLPSCNAIHTIGMRFAIDVAFVDASGCVCKIVRNVGRWRFAIAPRARTTIELAAGRVDQAGVNVGDRLYLESAPAV
jgi:uncharacterized protein